MLHNLWTISRPLKGSTFTEANRNQALGNALLSLLLFGLYKSHGHFEQYKSENKDVKFLSKARQKDVVAHRRRQFILLSAQHNKLKIMAIFGMLTCGFAYPYLTVENTYQASIVPGLLALPCLYLAGSMKQAGNTLSVTQALRSRVIIYQICLSAKYALHIENYHFASVRKNI